MSSDYKSLGLPDNEKWENAAKICHEWLTKHMTMFGPDRINSFMKQQPGAAAKLLIENCKDYSEESVAFALLGPAKSIYNQQTLPMFKATMGDKLVKLLDASEGTVKPDAAMQKDLNRLFIVEGLSMMGDQLIGRAHADKHHHIRWQMLESYEKNFLAVKGENAALDARFEDGLRKSREALEAVDAKVAAAQKSANGKKVHKPGM